MTRREGRRRPFPAAIHPIQERAVIARGFRSFLPGKHSITLGIDCCIYAVTPRAARTCTKLMCAGQPVAPWLAPLMLTALDMATLDTSIAVDVFYSFTALPGDDAAAVRLANGLQHDEGQESYAEIDNEIMAHRDERARRS